MMDPLLQECVICPRECGVDRYKGKGFCQAGAGLEINLAQLHFGEEPPISGTRGSGTIFFCHCNLRCVYCQNHQISLKGHGKAVSEAEAIKIMLSLQEQGAHNVNLVTPSHYAPQLVKTISEAKRQGLKIPVLYNSSAYDKVEMLRSLEDVVDIYLPDYKYHHAIYAKKYSHAPDYPKVAQNAIAEMIRQKGFLRLDSEGIATQGVLVRHLVLPHMLSGSRAALQMLASEFGTRIPISLMGQYYPAAEAHRYPELKRGITEDEYQKALDVIYDLGFECVIGQELSSDDSWTPDFVYDKAAMKSQGN